LHERALAIREARLGPDHPETATSLRYLASDLRARGDLDGARALYERPLASARLALARPPLHRLEPEVACGRGGRAGESPVAD
jgi:hypothetical protein